MVRLAQALKIAQSLQGASVSKTLMTNFHANTDAWLLKTPFNVWRQSTASFKLLSATVHAPLHWNAQKQAHATSALIIHASTDAWLLKTPFNVWQLRML